MSKLHTARAFNLTKLTYLQYSLIMTTLLKKIYLILASTIFCLTANSQGFEKVGNLPFAEIFGASDHTGFQAYEDASGNFVSVMGYIGSRSEGHLHATNVRIYDPNGAVLSNKTLDVPDLAWPIMNNFTTGRCYKPTPSGGLVSVFTAVSDPGTNKVYIGTYDSNYDSLWFNIVDLPIANEDILGIDLTSDGGYILTGSGTGSSSTLDMLLLKLDASGNQQWVNYYGGAAADSSFNVVQTADGGYLLAGSQDGVPTLIKTDLSGTWQWTKQISGWANSNYGYLQIAADGGYIATCVMNQSSYSVVKLDINGDTTWTRALPDLGFTPQDFSSTGTGTSEHHNLEVAEGPSGYFVAGYENNFMIGQREGLLYGLSLSGLINMQRKFTSSECQFTSIELTPGGKLILAGKASYRGGVNLPSLVLTDLNGNSYPNKLTGTQFSDVNGDCMQNFYSEWPLYGGITAISATDTFHYGFVDFDGLFEIQLPDGNYKVAGYDDLSYPFTPTHNGQLINDCAIDTANLNVSTDSINLQLGFKYGQILYGRAYWDYNNNCIKDPGEEFGEWEDPQITITNSIGQVAGESFWWQFGDFWTDNNSFGVPAGIGNDSYTVTSNYPIAGCMQSFTTVILNATNEVVYMDLPLVPKVIRGNFFLDTLANCTFDIGEAPYAGATVYATDGGTNQTFALTDSLGNYILQIPDTLVSYTVYANILTSNLANTCNPGPVVNPPFPAVTVEDFPLDILYICPEMHTTVSSPQVRPCMNSTYKINYYNIGTADAPNSYLDVTLSSNLSYVGSTVSFTSQFGNTYRFDLATMDAGEAGEFDMEVLVGCATIMGQTHCVEANIYPDSICVPVNPLWDLSSLEVRGACVNVDSVRFVIENAGAGNMTLPSDYRIIVDGIGINLSSFSLVSGDSIVLTYATFGETYRIEVDQVLYHPGFSFPCVDIEACGINGVGEFSIGHANSFYKDEYDLHTDISCRVATASFDPNDKIGTPNGFGATKIIGDDVRLHYRIRFQNTGTDTAFNVVVRDTLSQYLDPTTIQEGSTSHSGIMRMFGNGIVEWHFPLIMLPDSNVNEPLSHGYINFSIDQRPGNAIGTVIENDAAIFFDFNVPVITNTDFHTVGELIIGLEDVATENLQLHVYPNPFNDFAIIELSRENNSAVVLKVIDLQGNTVATAMSTGNQIRIDKGVLSAGVYLFEVTGEGQIFGRGKMVVQ
jgi:uncharacterized repeat protein (TIGR01451 family)